jgi:hypothetical protein
MTEEKIFEGPFTLEIGDGGKPLCTKPFTEPSEINFFAGNKEVMKFCGNGDVYINGELMENNKQLLDAMKAWLMKCSMYSEDV